MPDLVRTIPMMITAALVVLLAFPAWSDPAEDDATPAGEDTTASDSRTQPRVTVFVTSWCPMCRRTTSWLKDKDVEHEALDIERDKRALEMYYRAGGNGGVPLTLVGDTAVLGYDPSALQRALDRHGSKPAPEPEPEPEAGATRTVTDDGKVRYEYDPEDFFGEVHEPQVEYVTSRPDAPEASKPDPAMSPAGNEPSKSEEDEEQ